MKRTIWALVTVLVLTAGGCGGGGHHQAAPTTVVVPEPASSTVPPGQPDTSVIPPVITVPYVNAVLVKLNAIYSDGLRKALTAKAITPAVMTDFRAIYADPCTDRKLTRSKAQLLTDYPTDLRIPIGMQIITVVTAL